MRARKENSTVKKKWKLNSERSKQNDYIIFFGSTKLNGITQSIIQGTSTRRHCNSTKPIYWENTCSLGIFQKKCKISISYIYPGLIYRAIHLFNLTTDWVKGKLILLCFPPSICSQPNMGYVRVPYKLKEQCRISRQQYPYAKLMEFKECHHWVCSRPFILDEYVSIILHTILRAARR